VVGAVVKQGITLLSAIIVARLLTPDDYAIAGLALSVMGLFNVLTAQGFGQALVRRPQLAPLTIHSVFWFTLLQGLVLAVLAVLVAPLIAQFYRQPDMAPLLVFLAFTLVISMLGVVPNALLQRDMRFRDINLISISGGIIAAALGIGAAVAGFGYWALMMPGLGIALATVIGAYGLTRYRPAWVFSWQEIKSVAVFGFSMLGSQILTYFSDNSDYLIMGRFWTTASFGQYYFAFERARQPFNIVVAQLSSVVFPAFSKIQDDRERLRRAYLRGIRLVTLIVFPLHVLLIGLADPLVPWLFGEQWRPAVPVFQVFAAYGFVRGLAALVLPSLLAINYAQAIFAFNLFRLVFTVPALLYLGFNGGDILTTAIVLLVIWVVQAPFLIGFLNRKLGLTWRGFWSGWREVGLATVVMGLAFAAIHVITTRAGLPVWGVAALSALVSSALFVLLTRRELRDLVDQVRRAVRR
jgi:O-antigen/teichoic acid export membrane protein